MATELVEARGKLQAKQKELADIFTAAKTAQGYDFTQVKGMGLDGDQAARVEAVQAKNAELNDLADKVKSLQDVEDMAAGIKRLGDDFKQPAGGGLHPAPGTGGQAAQAKSLGQLFVESEAYTKRGQRKEADIDVSGMDPYGKGDTFRGIKTLMSTSAGWAPETIRTGKLVEDAQRPVQVLDYIPSVPTSQSAVVYMEETTFTNNAAETSEGSAFAEAALALTEQSSPVRKIAVFLPVTDEQLEDVAQVQAYVNNRLGFMLRQRLDLQVLVGDGTAPNLSGILDRSGLQTQALGTDPVPDAIYKAMTKVRVTGRATPNLVVLHPNDWQGIRLLRTADGIYIWGSPAEAGPERIWGVPVAQSDAITENTGLVGDFAMHSELAIRRNITLKVSDSHDDYFVKGKQAIRADMRVALQVYRPEAFCSVTGI